MKTLCFPFFTLIAMLPCSKVSATDDPGFTRQLQQYVESVVPEFDQISEERREAIHILGDYIAAQSRENNEAQVLFICTHNSRRSHLGQIWLQTAARYYGLDNIEVFSGGTETTAFNERIAGALERAGFQVSVSQKQSDNPRYLVTPGNDYPTSIHFSKRYQNSVNPQEHFAAVMVCSDADKSCPIVVGADERVSLPYEDPRYFDDTPSEVQKYDERTREIARDMLYLADYVKAKSIHEAEVSK